MFSTIHTDPHICAAGRTLRYPQILRAPQQDRRQLADRLLPQPLEQLKLHQHNLNNAQCLLLKNQHPDPRLADLDHLHPEAQHQY